MEKQNYITADEALAQSLATGMAAEEITEGYKAMETGVVDGYKKIEDGVVDSYKKIEDGVVGAFKKVEDSFVEKFLTHEGETAEDAKKRLAEQQAARAEESKNAGSH